MGSLFLLACPSSDDTEDGGGATENGDGSTAGATMTTAPPPTTDGPTATGPGATEGGSGSTQGPGDGTTAGVGSDSDSGGDDTTTGGLLPCAPDLPEPGACNAIEPPPPGTVGTLSVYLPEQSWGAPGDVSVGTAQGGVGFIPDPDGGGVSFECDIFAQDCPEGEKCMPWANDGGGAWNATRCSPVDAMPDLIGESCTVVGSGVSGVDSCEFASMCWNVDDNGEGVCVEMCGCSEVTPICQTPDTACAISNQGALALCLAACNPLDPAGCLEGEACYPVNGLFLCAPDASGDSGAVGDPCEFINACDTGTLCLDAAAVPGCAGATGCCSSMCEIGDDTSCLAGQACVGYYEGGQAPDACWAQTGVCTIPQ